MNPSERLRADFGEIDIYLFDQLLRGRIKPGARILDAGCGRGRNLVYLLLAGYEVFGVDADPANVQAVHDLASRLAPSLSRDNIRVESVEAMSFDAGFADVVISSAVLHFARDQGQFKRMLDGMWRALAPGGVFFCRLASSIGMEARVRPTECGRYLLPDGSERYLVDEVTLLSLTDAMGGRLLDPIKTTIVQNQRAMTTWVVGKSLHANAL